MARPSKFRLPPTHDNPESWYLRAEVAKLMSKHPSSIRYLEKTGALHPMKNARGEARFDPDEVWAYIRARSRISRGLTKGQAAARACALFRNGASREQVVETLEIDFAEAQRLWEEWQLGWEEAAQLRKKRELLEDEERRQLQRKRERTAMRDRWTKLLDGTKKEKGND